MVPFVDVISSSVNVVSEEAGLVNVSVDAFPLVMVTSVLGCDTGTVDVLSMVVIAVDASVGTEIVPSSDIH